MSCKGVAEVWTLFWPKRERERERERDSLGGEKFIDNQIDDWRSVSTTPLQGDTAAGHSWPSIGGEYYTPTLRVARV